MTNEIKEILDYLKDKKGYAINEFGVHKELTPEENNKLLHYITNLQEEIKEWEYIQDIQDKREYRKRYLEERRKEDPTLLYPDYDEIYKKYYEQKERIDKAVEYIDEHTIHDTPKKLKNGIYERGELIRTCSFYIEDLLDILRGDK